MSRPLKLLTTHRPQDTAYSLMYDKRERKALEAVGFEVIEFETLEIPFISRYMGVDGADVLIRCYSEEEREFERMVIEAGGRPIVPQMHTANNWYQTTAFAKHWYRREIGFRDMRDFGYLDEGYQMRALDAFLRLVFGYYGCDDKVFFKANKKHCLPPRVRTFEEALDEVTYWLALSCHNKLEHLIYSEPMQISKNPNGKYRRKEYRCFVVGDKVSTVSLFTDNPKYRNYTHVVNFAERYAKQFYNYLPTAYCLDVARLADTTMAVVEINGFGASGFFADHDLDKLFFDIKALRN